MPHSVNELWRMRKPAVSLVAEAQYKKAYAVEIKNAKYYDTGNKLDYLKTIVEYGLKNAELGEAFAEYIKQKAA